MTPEYTQTWSETIDPSTIPDAVVWSELGKRRRARQINAVPGTGRPPKLRPCPHCALEFASRDLRAHEPRCRRQRKKAETIAAARRGAAAEVQPA